MGAEPIDQGPPQSHDVDTGWQNEAEPVTGVPDPHTLPAEPVYGAPMNGVRKKKKSSAKHSRSGCSFPVIMMGGCMLVFMVCCCLPLCAAGIVFGGIAAIVSDSEATITDMRTIAVPEGETITLTIDNPVGAITIERGHNAEVEVEYTKRAYDWSHERARQELDKIDILITQPGGDNTVDVTVETDRQRNDFLAFANSVSLTIRVPESVHLTIISKVGAININDIIAESLDVQANTGAVEFNATLGQRLDGPYRIETNTGAITVKLPRDVYVQIDARAEVGDVDVRARDFDIVKDAVKTDEVVGGAWEGTFGEGAEDPPVLTLRSNTGAVMVEAQ